MYLPNVFSQEPNPFYATGHFLYPLKTKKSRDFLMFLRGVERDQWHEMN